MYGVVLVVVKREHHLGHGFLSVCRRTRKPWPHFGQRYNKFRAKEQVVQRTRVAPVSECSWLKRTKEGSIASHICATARYLDRVPLHWCMYALKLCRTPYSLVWPKYTCWRTCLTREPTIYHDQLGPPVLSGNTHSFISQEI